MRNERTDNDARRFVLATRILREQRRTPREPDPRLALGVKEGMGPVRLVFKERDIFEGPHGRSAGSVREKKKE